MAGFEVDLLTAIILMIGWLVAMIFIMFIAINKNMRWELFKTFDKKTPRFYVVTPSKRLKRIFGKWADDTGKKISLGFVKNKNGRAEEKIVHVVSQPYMEDGSNAPAFLYKQGAAVNSDITKDELPDQESDSIAYNRIWENALLWKSLTGAAVQNLDKILIILIIILILVAAFNGILSFQVLDYLSRLPAPKAAAAIIGGF